MKTGPLSQERKAPAAARRVLSRPPQDGPAQDGPAPRAAGDSPGQPVAVPAPGGRAARLAWLDSLRGIAALVVVADHMIYTMGMFRPLRGFLSQWIALGQYGVFLFFLVSGYIVPVSLERKNSVRSFWVSRAFRLYPVYLAATAGLVALAWLGMGSLAGAGQRPVSSVLGHLLMMSGLLNAPNVPYTVWTLSYEMVFYLLITALFLARAHRRSDRWAVGFAALALLLGGLLPGAAFLDSVAAKPVVDLVTDTLIIGGVALAVAGQRRLQAAGAAAAAVTALALVALNRSPSTPQWEALTIFALMFTGTVIYRAEHGQIGKRRAAAVVAAVFALALAGLMWRAHQHGVTGLADMLASQRTWLTALPLAGATFLAGLALRRRRVPQVLTWLGMVSYSVYLVHPLLLGIYENLPWHPAGVLLEQVLTALAFLAVVLAISTLSYRFVEVPGQRLGKRAARRLGAGAPAPAWAVSAAAPAPPPRSPAPRAAPWPPRGRAG